MSKAIARDPNYRCRRFQPEIIELCVRWYLTYRLSYRDLSVSLAATYRLHADVPLVPHGIARLVAFIHPGGCDETTTRADAGVGRGCAHLLSGRKMCRAQQST
jgi:hypothetical protein